MTVVTGDRERVGADPRFKVRGPYWRPGQSILVEPWAAIAECNTGHRVQLYGRSSARALEMVQRWRLLTERGEPIDGLGIRAVSAAVVNPRGDVTASWVTEGAVPPVPGGTPRWSTLHRVAAPVACLGCKAERWAGCWMPRDLSGCAECLPARETDDPRVWPIEPPPVVERVKVERVKTPKTRKARPRASVVSPDGDRLF